MLTNGQITWIRNYGISTFHDYWCTSLASGEPFLENGILSYYDGRFVTVCGCQFREQPAVADEVLRESIIKWANSQSVHAIAVIAPQSLKLLSLSKYGFRRTYQEDSSELSAELLVEFGRESETIFHRGLYRRSSKLEFKSVIRSGGIVPAEYYNLIETLYAVRDISCYLADIAFALPALLRSSRVQFVEARRDGRLCGFVCMHKAFKNTAVALFLSHDHWTPGVCDFLYAKMLDRAYELGVESINIGSCPTIGHYKFKRKWGAVPGVAAYNYTEWARGFLARRTYKSWGPRIVRL